MALLTVDEVKVFLNISDSSRDDSIEFYIPIVEADINEYCNTTYTGDTWPVWMKIPGANMIGYLLNPPVPGLASESQGGYSYTREALTGGYPESITKALIKGKKARARFPAVKGQYRDLRGMTEGQIVTGVEPNKYED